MRLTITFLVLFYLCLPSTGTGKSFKQALPGYTYEFPRDDFSHDDFRIEWWYYTGNLKDIKNRPFGYQLTFFRVRLQEEQPTDNAS